MLAGEGVLMRVETICTGDELLTGLTSDTNSRHFQSLLLERTGLTVRRSTVVGDDQREIVEALEATAARCDVVLVSGGLGPTIDDITVDCAAIAVKRRVVESQEVAAHIETRYRKRGVEMTANNRRQARIPEGAEAIISPAGAAPLIIFELGRCTFFLVPGVPAEYQYLVEHHVVPRIGARATAQVFRKLRVLKTIGIPESRLDDMVRPLVERHPKVTFGFRTHAPENHLKLMAQARDAEEAAQVIQRAEADCRALLGASCFGADDDTLASVIEATLRTRGEHLVVAESCTGGLIASALVEPAGASDAFFGSAVTYTESAKRRWAAVTPEILDRHTAVSEETARALAVGILHNAEAQWSLAVTGIAGPSGATAAHPVGTVFISVARCDAKASPPTFEVVRVERFRFHGDRTRIRHSAAHTALDVLRRVLES
jgi:nicotinamide-nucleotide amidase